MCIHAIHDVDKICMIRKEQRCSLQFLAAAVVIMNKVSLSRTHDDISYFSLLQYSLHGLLNFLKQ